MLIFLEEHPVVDMVIWCVLAVLFIFVVYVDMPPTHDPKTGARRTFAERWRIANREARGSVVLAGLYVLAALASVVYVLFPE